MAMVRPMRQRGVLAILAALIAGGAIAADAPPPSAQARPPEKIYAVICGYCHGANVGPILLGRHLQVDYIKTMVRSGPNAMPAFRPTEVSDAELDALTRWIAQSPASDKDHGK